MMPLQKPVVPIFADLQCAACLDERDVGCLYANRHELEVHVRIEHVRLMPYRCQFCPYIRLPTELSLKEHLTARHSDGKNPKIMFSVNEQLEKRVVEILRASMPDEAVSTDNETEDYGRSELVPSSESLSGTSMEATDDGSLHFSILPNTTHEESIDSHPDTNDVPSEMTTYSGDVRLSTRPFFIPLVDHKLTPLTLPLTENEDSLLDNLTDELDLTDESYQLIDDDTNGGVQQVCALCGADVPEAQWLMHVQENHVDDSTDDKTKELLTRCLVVAAFKTDSNEYNSMGNDSSKSSIRTNVSQKLKLPPPRPHVQCQQCRLAVDRREVSSHVFRYHVRQAPFRCSDCDFVGRKTTVELHLRRQHCAANGGRPTATAVSQRADFEADVQKFYTLCFPDLDFKYRPRKKMATKRTDASPPPLKTTPAIRRVECQQCHLEVDRRLVSVHVFKQHVKQPPFCCPVCDFAGGKSSVLKHIRLKHVGFLSSTAVNQRSYYEADVQKLYKLCFPDIGFQYRPRNIPMSAGFKIESIQE